jgi:acetolactate synthase-1/2/3 large subunit
LADTLFATQADWGASRVSHLHRTEAARPLPEAAPGRLRPQQLLQILRRHAPHDLVVATDVGSHKILAGLSWPALTPNRYLLSNGLSCMGYALPAAVAASLAQDGRTTIALTGDAGISMVMGELGLIQELATPVIIVVFNDSALDLIRSAQLRANHPPFGTEFSNPDFLQIATAYGLDAVRVADETACSAAIQRALTADRPCLIEAMIDPVSYPTTPH